MCWSRIKLNFYKINISESGFLFCRFSPHYNNTSRLGTSGWYFTLIGSRCFFHALLTSEFTIFINIFSHYNIWLLTFSLPVDSSPSVIFFYNIIHHINSYNNICHELIFLLFSITINEYSTHPKLINNIIIK